MNPGPSASEQTTKEQGRRQDFQSNLNQEAAHPATAPTPTIKPGQVPKCFNDLQKEAFPRLQCGAEAE
jgi:hypothetical protein